MSLAGASTSAPISLAAATGHALPRRLLALVADTVVISLLDSVVNATFGVTRVTGGVVPSIASGSFASFTTQTTVDWIWLALFWVAYYAVLEALFGATPGKLIAGLRVTDLEGRRIGWQPAMLRNLARLIDALPFLYLLGGILTLGSRQHQRLGDRFAGTLVVPASAAVGQSLSRVVMRRRGIVLTTVVVVLLGLCAVFAYFGRPPLVIEGAKNTGTSVFGQGVGTFRLGSARWGNGKVTYPINYEIAQTNQSCFGDITLTWNGFPGGWQLDGAQSTCSPRIYP